MRPYVSACWFSLVVIATTASTGCGDEAKRRLGATCASDAECQEGVCGGGICIDPREDADQDGLPNELELALGTNPLSADSDNDGIRDGDELDESLGLLDIDQDGTPDVLESATLDEDDDCIPNQFDPQNTVADSDLAGLVAIVCRTEGVCGAAIADLEVICDASSGKRAARCDYAAVTGFEPDEATCDGLDNDCDGAVDEQSSDLDDDGVADCVDDDDDGDGVADAIDLCPAIVDPAQADSDGDGLGDACDTPQPPVVTATDPVSPATDGTPLLLGVADPSCAIDIFGGTTCAAEPLATGSCDADGGFAIEVPVGDNSETRFVLRATNSAGLVSACIPSAFRYVHDDTPPLAPTFTSITPSSPSTDDSPRVSGNAEAGARVELHASVDCKGAPLGAGNANATGDFSILVNVSANASTIIRAAAIDRAGNRSSCATLTTYVHDGERPDPPSPHPIPFTPASPSASEPNPVLRGCAEDGANIDVYSQPGCLGPLEAQLTADVEDAECPTGAAFFGLVAATPNATTTFQAQVRGSTDRLSACVPVGVYVHDGIAPTAPIFVSANPSSPSSLATPTILGRAEPGIMISLHDTSACEDASTLGSGLSLADGTFLLVATLPANEGTEIFGKATDIAGNTSACAPLTRYVHDDTVPVAPSPHPLTVFIPASPSRSEDAPFLRGCAAEGATVRVFTSDGCTGSALATLRALIPDEACSTGFAFSGTVQLSGPVSSTTLRAQTVNDADVRSACATLGTYVFDALAPAEPVLDTISPPSPAAMTTPVLTGSAEAGVTVTLYRGAGCASGVAIGSTIAGADGAWVALGALEGLNTTTRLHASARDSAGNVSSCAALATWVHDDIPPRAPRMLASQIAAVPSPSNDPAPNVRFCTEIGTTVRAYLTPDCSGTNASASVVAGSLVCAGIGGSEEQRFSLAVAAPATWYVRGVDAAGNRGDCLPLFDYRFDGDAPGAPKVTRVRGTSWTMLDANTVGAVDLEIGGDGEPGTSVALFIDGTAKGSALVDDAGRFIGSVSGVSVSTPDVRLLQTRATDAAGNVGPMSLGRAVVGPLDLTVTRDAVAQAGVAITLHFPDGGTYFNGASNARGVVQHRIFAGMMATVGLERPDGSRTKRVLETWMDLMPGDSIPIDLTPPAAQVQGELTTEVQVQLPPQQAGATSYLVQSACGTEERTTDVQTSLILSFPESCAKTGDSVSVLATALRQDPNAPAGVLEVVAYAFRPDLVLTPQGNFVGFSAWETRTSPGTSLVDVTFTVHNDTETPLTGVLQSHHVRGARPDDFAIAQLTPDGGGFGGSMYLLPGASNTTTLPFITEVGPWRRLFAALAFQPGDKGLIALSYEIEQGLGALPATFGTRSVRTDLLPILTPDYLVARGTDANRPEFGWFSLGSIERADVAAATFVGRHNCTGTCSDTSATCSLDSDCVQGGSCFGIGCDELEWRIAWRPWDGQFRVRIPVLPNAFSPAVFWSPSGQDGFDMRNVGFMDLDFIDGWDQAKALGRGVFPFGDGDFLGEILPAETKVLLTFLGDN